MLKVFSDAGYGRLGQSPIYIAHVIELDKEGAETIVNMKKIDVPAKSSSQAEYYGLIYAMTYCLLVGEKECHFHSDNQTMVYQIQGRYKCNETKKDLVVLLNEVNRLWKKFRLCRISWVPREWNKADCYVDKIKRVYKSK